MAPVGAEYQRRMDEHAESTDEPHPERDDENVAGSERVVPADQTVDGVGDVESGGESLDP